MRGLILLGVIVLIGLPSCGVMDKYESPKVDVNGLYRDRLKTDTATAANIPWREYFADTNLVVLINEGVQNNFDLQIAYTRIQQSEASLSMAKAAFFPNVALAGQVSNTGGSGGDRGVDVLGYSNTKYLLGVTASWELDVWGKLNRQSKAKYAQFLNSQAYRNLVQTSLVANIASSYYSLLALDEKLSITLQTVKVLEGSVETMEALKNAGKQNGAAVEQSKSLLYSTKTAIPDLESQIRQLENSICLLLGRKPGVITRSVIQKQQIPEEMKYGIPAQMLAKRPDVQQAELNFRSAFELTNAAQASFYPSITLTSASLGFGTANTLANFFKPENILASIVGGLTQPIFAKKQLTGNLKIAKAQQKEALLNFEKSVLTAGREVSDILFSFSSSMKKKLIRDQEIEASKNAVYYTQELLKAGEANYTEVLNAEQSLLSAQLSQVNDKLELLQCTVNLYKALGGGVE